MQDIFIKLLNMSINASWVVFAVILLRLLLKKMPKKFNVHLWIIVAIRLVLPFSFESIISLMPSTETVPSDIMMNPMPEINTGIPLVNSVINPIITENFSPDPGDSANPLQIVMYVASVLWIVGVASMLIYALVSYLLVRKKTSETTLIKENIYMGDRIATPFILGVIKPKIYLPSCLDESDMQFVIAHEKAHLSRKDHLWKPLGFLLLTVYWFNPVLWLAYVLLCRDIELACDEKVIDELGVDTKKSYAQALINCSVPRKLISACPVAFGEVGVKSRIKSVLSYKKPAFWLIIIAVITSIVATVCFVTDPESDASEIFGKTYGGELIYSMQSISYASIYMGYCDIADNGRLSVVMPDNIISYGKLMQSDFDHADLLRMLPTEDSGIIIFNDIVKAYETAIPTASGNEQKLVIFVTDDDRIYRVNVVENDIMAIFRLYETELFEDMHEPSLSREVKEAILGHNMDNYYIAKNKNNFDDNTVALAVVSSYGGHEIINADNDTRTVYCTMLYEEYVRDSKLNVLNVTSQSSPVKLVFKEQKDGSYKLKDYVQPNPEMKGMPEDFNEYLFNSEWGVEYDEAAIMKKLRADCHGVATSYFGLFGSYSSDADYILYGISEQNILIHRDNAYGSYYEPYVLGEGVRLRHSDINMSGSIDPEDVDIYDYNLTFGEALSGDKAVKKLKEISDNFADEKHMLDDNDLYLINVIVCFNEESDKKDFLPVTGFVGAVNSEGELINSESRFDIASYTNKTENGKVSNWYTLLVPKGEQFRAVYVIGSIHEAPGPTERVYFDITARERNMTSTENTLNLYQDKIAYDIDNDNVIENCYITAGPTSGIFTFCFAAFHNGELEYFNIFAPSECMDLSFKINDYSDKLQITGWQSESSTSFVYTYDVTVTHSDTYGDNIMLHDMKYWGEQGIESPWADFTQALQQIEYIDELRGRYPYYFDLPTDKGLAVYVWQMSETNYQCTLVEDKNLEHPMKIVLNNEGISIKNMKAIIESYNLPEEDIVIKPYINPASSYLYETDDAYQKTINAQFGR